MKWIFCFLVLCGCASFTSAQSEVRAADYQKLKWLEGVWIRINAKPGRTGREEWTQVAVTEMLGLGVTLQGKDTVSMEKIRLVVKDNEIFYVAEPRENDQPTYFLLTAIAEISFVCENSEHDFPKKITYGLIEGNKLKATISGGGKSIDYYFSRQ